MEYLDGAMGLTKSEKPYAKTTLNFGICFIF